MHAAFQADANQTWSTACAQVQLSLNLHFSQVMSDLRHKEWPAGLEHHGLPPALAQRLVYRDTWSTRWEGCSKTKCFFVVHGVANGTWSTAHLLTTGLGGGCLWDWDLHRPIWEIVTPEGPKYLAQSPVYPVKGILIGLGTLWRGWPNSPPDMVCVTPLPATPYITLAQRVCWEGPGRLYHPNSTFWTSCTSCCAEAQDFQGASATLYVHDQETTLMWPKTQLESVTLNLSLPKSWVKDIDMPQLKGWGEVATYIKSLFEDARKGKQLALIAQEGGRIIKCATNIPPLCKWYEVVCTVQMYTFTNGAPFPWFVVVISLVIGIMLFNIIFKCCCYKIKSKTYAKVNVVASANQVYTSWQKSYL